MIGYVTVGTNDLEKAAKFYDALFSELGAKRQMENERMIGWSAAEDQPLVLAIKPQDGNKATVGNGMMVSLAAPNAALVDKLHAKALSLGGADEGAPGDRGDGFYGAYFRDLDGNKYCAFCQV